jgi:phosphatidylglycerol---prolipoprotein diacylglyceryl transferase
MFLAYWVHNLSPFVIQFTDTIGIRYYGLAYLLGFVGGGLLLHAYARAGRSQLASALVPDFIIALVVGVMLGGRIGSFLLYDGWRSLGSDPLAFFRIWQGGMASHGGFIGVAVAIAWFSHRHRIGFLHLADLIVSVAPLGLMLGRIANFINGELWGKITDVPWAVIFPDSPHTGLPLALIPPRHPSQLYEAALEGALLLALMQWRFWRTYAAARQPGRIAGEFLIAYAVVRMLGELFREPDTGISLILGLSRGTFYSFFLIIVGAVIIWRAPHRSTPQSNTKPKAA